MELLERYLQAVGKQLPQRRRQDILAELRANLEAQLEDKEAELGRELKQGEAEDWLRELGSPMQVAARYLPQQWLIGPGFFPVYWYALRLALVWALAVYSVVTAVQVVVGHAEVGSIAGAIFRAPFVLFEVAAWVTLAFAILEVVSARFPGKCAEVMRGVTEWSPASLPPLEKPHPVCVPKSYAHAVAEVVFRILFLGWLALIPEYPFLLLGPGVWYVHTAPFALAPTVMIFYYCVLGVNAFQLVWQGMDLMRGRWQRPQWCQHLVFKALAVVPIGVLLSAPGHRLLLLKNPALDGARYGTTVATVNHAVHTGLVVVLVIVVLQAVWELGRWALWARGGGVGGSGQATEGAGKSA